MADPDLQLQTLVLREVVKAIEPYAKEVDDLKYTADRAAKYAEDDRQRLIKAAKEDVERIAEEVAEKAVGRILEKFGLDPSKAGDFRKMVDWLNDLQSTIRDARKHGITVIVGGVVLLLGSWIWTAFKASILK